MKSPAATLLGCLAFAVLPASSGAAGNADRTTAAAATVTVAQSATPAAADPSTRKKPRAAAPAAAQSPPAAGWRGPDPTRGPGTDRMRQMQREGTCFIDEGYGRYSMCSNE